VILLVFSTAEVDALRLLRLCRYIPVSDMAAVFNDAVFQTLFHFDFIKVYQKHEAYVLTEAGSRFLDANLDDLPPYIPPNYHEEDYLRRSRVAKFTLTAYRAGLSPFHTELSSLTENGVCYLTSLSRTMGLNPWGSTRIAALLRLGDMVCGVHYLCVGIGLLSLNDELTAFENNTALLSGNPRSIIFTGESYADIFNALAEPKPKRKTRRITYGKAYERFSYPVHFIPCGEVGARQLRMMLHADYRARMTVAALGSHAQRPPKEHPEWDALFEGTPFIMAADMDFTRIDAAVRSAKECGRAPVYLAALDGQIGILQKRYKSKGLAKTVLVFDPGKEAVRRQLALYSPSVRHFETAEGVEVCAPPI
jgi:hypothetical protein